MFIFSNHIFLRNIDTLCSLWSHVYSAVSYAKECLIIALHCSSWLPKMCSNVCELSLVRDAVESAFQHFQHCGRNDLWNNLGIIFRDTQPPNDIIIIRRRLISLRGANCLTDYLEIGKEWRKWQRSVFSLCT